MDHFTPEVCEKIGHYVYRLVDPRNGETFYVGRGVGNRVFQHATAAKGFEVGSDDIMPERLDQIRGILNVGLKVIHVIHRHGIPANSVAEVEAALIDAYPGLKNIQGGYGSSDRGPMSHTEIISKYALPELPENPTHKLILLNINRLEERYDRCKIYEWVRGWWRLSRKRAEKAEYVLAVYKGVVIGAFQPNNWIEKSPEQADVEDPSARFGFEGKEAPDDIWELYVGANGKRVTQKDLRHSQNPIRYWKC